MRLRLSAILPLALFVLFASACGSAGANGLVTPATDKLTFLYFYIDG
ncbi:MAG: hypothetical protein HND51_11310 [Chloroflexi bacterium]|nr:hypothetical protein [Chloroflexota bacterium]